MAHALIVIPEANCPIESLPPWPLPPLSPRWRTARRRGCTRGDLPRLTLTDKLPKAKLQPEDGDGRRQWHSGTVAPGLGLRFRWVPGKFLRSLVQVEQRVLVLFPLMSRPSSPHLPNGPAAAAARAIRRAAKTPFRHIELPHTSYLNP